MTWSGYSGVAKCRYSISDAISLRELLTKPIKLLGIYGEPSKLLFKLKPRSAKAKPKARVGGDP